ncbi:MAG: Uncharacterised protein [Owenweeksia sp. TMED14]|nr:MAG: Uncharacterised protein [Owenweeksia sp. TMED14]
MLHVRLIAIAFGLSISFLANSQSLSLQQVPNLSKCTGDSLKLTLTIAAPGVNPANDFHVMMSVGAFASASSDTLPIVKWESVTPSPVGTLADTISAGLKYVWVVVPSTITQNASYGLVIRSTSPGLWSDTIQMSVNVAPVVFIDTIVGGFVNLHTSGNDWGMCEGDTIVIHANEGLNSYQWTSSGVIIAGATSDSLIVTTSGDYGVIGSSGICSLSTTDTTINAFAPTTSITHVPTGMFTLSVLDKDAQIDSLQFCESESIMLRGPLPSGSGVSVSYQWLKDTVDMFMTHYPIAISGEISANFTTGTSGKYSLVTSWNPGGCPDTSFAVEVFVDTVPDTYIENIMWAGQTVASLDICPGDSTLLRAHHQSFLNDWNYQWEVMYPIASGIWQQLPKDTTFELTVDTALISGSAQYRLVVDSKACTWTTGPLQVNLIPLPVVNVAPKDSLGLCAGDSILIGVTGTGLTYQWIWSSGSYTGSSFYAKDSGVYTVQATGLNNCTSFDTIQITEIIIVPNAGVDQTVMPGEVVQLGASGGTSYYWYADKPVYFSDPSNSSTLTRPTSDTTKYFVEVRSSFGCFGIDSMLVIQFDPATLDSNLDNVMNVITPNGDGFNDFFDLSEVVQSDSCNILILNRWGAKVFEQKKYTTGWDGTTIGGDPLPDGTYYYLLLCNGNDVGRFRGAITVIRNN